jgi:hypothetical protein
VPDGIVAAPVVESALIKMPAAAGTVITKFDAVSTAFSETDPPDGALSFTLPAISIPYAV